MSDYNLEPLSSDDLLPEPLNHHNIADNSHPGQTEAEKRSSYHSSKYYHNNNNNNNNPSSSSAFLMDFQHDTATNNHNHIHNNTNHDDYTNNNDDLAAMYYDGLLTTNYDGTSSGVIAMASSSSGDGAGGDQYDYDYPLRQENQSFLDRLSCGSIVYLLPIIVISGIILNFGAICIMSGCRRRRKVRRESSFLNYLLALSTFDIFILLFMCPIHLPPAIIMCGSENSSLDVTVYALLLLPFIQTAKYASIWCITNIAVQRYFAICKPFYIQRYKILRSHNKSIALLTLFAFCINIPQFWVITLGPMPDRNVNGSLIAVTMGIVPGPLHVTNNKHYYIVNEIMVSLLLYVIPLLLLIVLTVKTMAYIWRSRRNFVGGPKNGRSSSSRSRGRAEANRTFLTIAIVITFFACHTLSILLTWLRIAQIFGFHIQLQTERILNDFGNFLVALNSALNPLLYLYFTRKFKDLIEVRKKSAAGGGGTRTDGGKWTTHSYGGFTLNSFSSMSIYRKSSSPSRGGRGRGPGPAGTALRSPIKRKQFSLSANNIINDDGSVSNCNCQIADCFESYNVNGELDEVNTRTKRTKSTLSPSRDTSFSPGHRRLGEANKSNWI